MLGIDVPPIKNAEDASPQRLNLSGKGSEVGEFGTAGGGLWCKTPLIAWPQP